VTRKSINQSQPEPFQWFGAARRDPVPKLWELVHHGPGTCSLSLSADVEILYGVKAFHRMNRSGSASGINRNLLPKPVADILRLDERKFPRSKNRRNNVPTHLVRLQIQIQGLQVSRQYFWWNDRLWSGPNGRRCRSAGNVSSMDCSCSPDRFRTMTSARVSAWSGWRLLLLHCVYGILHMFGSVVV
jgi:hypothetical protein